MIQWHAGKAIALINQSNVNNFRCSKSWTSLSNVHNLQLGCIMCRTMMQAWLSNMQQSDCSQQWYNNMLVKTLGLPIKAMWTIFTSVNFGHAFPVFKTCNSDASNVSHNEASLILLHASKAIVFGDDTMTCWSKPWRLSINAMWSNVSHNDKSLIL